MAVLSIATEKCLGMKSHHCMSGWRSFDLGSFSSHSWVFEKRLESRHAKPKKAFKRKHQLSMSKILSFAARRERRKRKCFSTHLNPGTGLTMDPSFVSHVMRGIGFPCATHVSCAPVLLLKVTCDGGSCTKDGICTRPPWRLWSLTTIDAKHIWYSPVMGESKH